MSNLRKIFWKFFTFLSVSTVLILITAIFTSTVPAETPTGPFILQYFADSNGSIDGSAYQVVDLGGNGTPVTAVSTGYHFVEWSDGSTQNPRTDTNVTADISVTANFAIDTFTLNYTAGEGGSLTGNTSQTVDYYLDGTAVTAVPDIGHHFVEWSDGSTDNPRTDTVVDYNVDVVAVFAPDTFYLDYADSNNGYLSGDTYQEVEYMGDGTPVTAIADEYYHFTDWSDGSTNNPRTDYDITEDLYVTANFSLNTYSLIYTAGDNGSITGETNQTVVCWENGTTVTAVAYAGYQFVGWSDGSTQNPRTDYNVMSNVEVSANFAFLYTVKFDSQGGSTIADELVPSGGKVKYPISPSKAGSYFAGWYKEASCVNIWHTNIDLISSDTTLYAKWNSSAPKIALLYGDSYYYDIRNKLISTGFFSQVDAISLSSATPTLGMLKQYNAVFLYTNGSTFSDSTPWGDVLADYADYGGGIVMATFAYMTPGGSMGVGGRISTDGYLPFTQTSSGSEYYQTLVADVASDPILNGVNSFNGGESSYHCTISLASGATLIAHWSNDYPLVATKQLTNGRFVGLNFFPISSDVRSDFWDASTDGTLLMANSLVWAASTSGTISAPVITSNDGNDTAFINVEENQTAVTTVTATDPDSATLAYSIIGGYDDDCFTIDSSTGVLEFKTAPDFEAPTNYYDDNIYEVTVQVSDGELSDTQEISVTVTDAPNEAPVISSNGGDATANIEAKEEQTAVTTVIADDPDNNTLTYSISGGSDSDLFAIDSSSGVLTFKAAPDFETKADSNSDGIYEITVEVSDGSLTDTQNINVTVTLLTPVDLLENLKSDINSMNAEGNISSSTTNGLVRTIDKAIAKINAGDNAGAIKLLNSLKTTITRQIPRKIPANDWTTQIDQVISRLNS
ncbi:MAG: InlB B-repeat-containing protein [Saccharofermentanales bacterium]